MSQQIGHIKRLQRKQMEAQQRANRLIDRFGSRYQRRTSAHCRQSWKFGRKAFKAQHKFIMEFIRSHPAIQDLAAKGGEG